MQEEAEHDQGALFGRVGVGPRLGSGSITVGVAWDSLFREPVLPVVSWTILDHPGHTNRYREMFFGLTDRGLAAGGTLEFARRNSFAIGVLFFGGGKSTDAAGGGGFLATLSLGRGRAAGPLGM